MYYCLTWKSTLYATIMSLTTINQEEPLHTEVTDTSLCSFENAPAITIYTCIVLCAAAGIGGFLLIVFDVIGPTFYVAVGVFIFCALLAMFLGCKCYKCDCPSCFKPLTDCLKNCCGPRKKPQTGSVTFNEGHVNMNFQNEGGPLP